MAPSYPRLVPADIGNLVPFNLDKPVLLLLKVASLNDVFEGDFGKGSTAFTPTLSSPQPQAGALAGKLTKALLGASTDSLEETTLNFDTYPTCIAAPIDATQRAFNAPIPSFNSTGLFDFMVIPNFETLFNILVILGLLYLFFTPSVGDDTTMYQSFGLVDTIIPRDSDLDSSKTVCCPCYVSATGTVRLGRARKVRSISSVKQAALVFSRSPCRTPVKRSSVPRVPLRTVLLEYPDRPIQSASATEPLAQVDSKAISSNTQTTEDTVQATRPDFRGIRWRGDLGARYSESDNSAQPSTPSVTSSAGPSEVHDQLSNLKTSSTEDKVDSEAGRGTGKEVSLIVHKNCQHACPPSSREAIPKGNTEQARKIIAPQVRAPGAISNFNADRQAQPPMHDASTEIQGLASLPSSQHPFTRRPAVNASLPIVPVGPIYIDIPMTQAPPVIPIPAQPIVPMVLPAAPPSWFQHQVAISSSSYFAGQSVAPPITIAPQLHIAQPNCAHTPADHLSGSDQYMDITDEDGDSWMHPSGFGEAITLPEPAPQALAQAMVASAEGTPQCAHGTSLTQYEPVVVACDTTPAVGPTRGPLGLNAYQMRKKVRAYRLHYGPHLSPLAPSPNRKAVRLYRTVGLRKRGPIFNPPSTRNNNLARISMLQKRALLRKKAAARSLNPPLLEKSSTPQVDDQPKAMDPIIPVDPITPMDPVAPVDPPSPQKKGRSYFDRLYVNRTSPFSQHSPSEISLMACKVIPKSASLKKAFIWQRHFAARDRRTAGTDGRIGVFYENDPTTSQQVVAGSQRQPTPLQRKTPAGDHVYLSRKRPTVADFIRAEDVEREKEILDAATDALQSMDLNSGNFISAFSTSGPAYNALETSPLTSSSYVTQDLEFHRDQAQLLLEDIFEDREKKQNCLMASVSSLFSSDPDSEDEDD